MSEDIFLVVQVRDDEDHNLLSAAAVNIKIARKTVVLISLYDHQMTSQFVWIESVAKSGHWQSDSLPQYSKSFGAT